MIPVCPIGILLSGIDRKVRKLTLLSGIVAVTFGGGGGALLSGGQYFQCGTSFATVRYRNFIYST